MRYSLFFVLFCFRLWYAFHHSRATTDPFFFCFVSFFSSCMLFSFCQSELTTHKTTGCDGRCVTFWRGIPNVQFGHHLRTTGGAVLSQSHLKIHLNCGLFYRRFNRPGRRQFKQLKSHHFKAVIDWNHDFRQRGEWRSFGLLPLNDSRLASVKSRTSQTLMELFTNWTTSENAQELTPAKAVSRANSGIQSLTHFRCNIITLKNQSRKW